MEIRPLHNRVLLRRVDEETTTSGGIIIPVSAQEGASKGEIVAVGSGYVNDNGEVRPLDVKVGDRVLFSQWVGDKVMVDSEELLIVEEEKIIGVIAA